MNKKLFYKCNKCGNIIEVINGNVDLIKCCGENMSLLVANTFDASTEKHIPVYEISDDKLYVTVGEIEHPMDEDHYIMWVALVTDDKIFRINLLPGNTPKATFPYISNSVIYSYCNKHGLWMKTIE